MRTKRCRFWVPAVFTGLIVALMTAGAAPPPTPEARSRGRLRSGATLPSVLYTHSNSVEHAAIDSEALKQISSKYEMAHIRYLSVHNTLPQEREDYARVSSFLMSGFIKHRRTVVPVAIGGPDDILIRINLLDYGVSLSAWDKLAVKDPYFHQYVDRTDVKTVGQTYTEEWVPKWFKTGKTLANGEAEWKQWLVLQQVPTPVTVDINRGKVQVAASWLNPSAAGALAVNCQTNYPILRADWFITNVSVEPHYSDFLGIKTLDELKRWGGFDERADFTKVRATIVRSGSDGSCPRVARNNRILERRDTFNGDWWETLDYKTSVGQDNVIFNFVNRKRAAAEYIVRAPNGLQWYMITDGNDKALAEGDPKIVLDSLAQDSFVKNGRSCIWCHASGINPFRTHFQDQVGFRPDQADLGLYDKDPKKAALLRQQIQDVFGLPDFNTVIKGDQARYNAAVQKCSGWTAEENAAAFMRIWNGYAEEDITVTQACMELGLSEPELQMILGLRFNGKSNGVLIQALLKPPIAIRRDQWEESFFEAAMLSTLKGRFQVVPVLSNTLPPKVPGR